MCLMPHTRKSGVWGVLSTSVGCAGVHKKSQEEGMVVWSSGPRYSPRTQGAWRPEGPQLPATPSALWEERSPSCITLHWAALTNMNLSDSLTSQLVVMKWGNNLDLYVLISNWSQMQFKNQSTKPLISLKLWNIIIINNEPASSSWQWE